MVDKRVDGMIVVPADPFDTAHLQEAQDRGIPIVLFDRSAPDIRCDMVVVDNAMAVRNAVQHLVRLGHRRIAIVVEASTSIPAAELLNGHPHLEHGLTSALREIGWSIALREAELPVTEELILRARYDRADACRVTSAALASAERPTALLTTDEAMTLGVLDAIRAAGLEMPRDVSLIGFERRSLDLDHAGRPCPPSRSRCTTSGVRPPSGFSCASRARMPLPRRSSCERR